MQGALFLHTRPDRPPVLTQPPVKGGTGSFPGVKRPGRDVDNPLSSNAGPLVLPMSFYGVTFVFTLIIEHRESLCSGKAVNLVFVLSLPDSSLNRVNGFPG